MSENTAKTDLEAVPDILVHLAIGSSSWEDFQVKKPGFAHNPSQLNLFLFLLADKEIDSAD